MGRLETTQEQATNGIWNRSMETLPVGKEVKRDGVQELWGKEDAQPALQEANT